MGSRELTAYMIFEVGSVAGTSELGKVVKGVRRYTGGPFEGGYRVHVKIAYYSRKGTTKGLAEMVAKAIQGRGHHVTMVPIRHVKKKGFLGAGRASQKMQEMELANDEVDFQLGDADLVIVGGPIFAYKVDPYTRTFLKRASGLEGKPGGVLITCGARPKDAQDYMNEMVGLVSAKGLRVRARLLGSNKLRDEYQAMAEQFAADVLDTAPAEVGGDSADDAGDDGGDGDGGNGGNGGNGE
jgi:menaquinone-dependent protoporphyrinogen IX oxidase